MPPTPVLTQISFRGGNDNGSETSRTWKTGENKAFPVRAGYPFRFRALIGVTVVPTSKFFNLEYSSDKGATWALVTTSSTVKAVATSQSFADHDPTTNQMLIPSPYAFTPGTIQTNDAASGSVALLTNQAAEIEWTLQADAGSYLLRVVADSIGTPLNSYLVYGEVASIAVSLTFSQRRAYKDVIGLYSGNLDLTGAADGFIKGKGVPSLLLDDLPVLIEQTDYAAEPTPFGRSFTATLLTNDIVEMTADIPIEDAQFFIWKTSDGVEISRWFAVAADPQVWPSSGAMKSNYLRVRAKECADPTVVPTNTEVA